MGTRELLQAIVPLLHSSEQCSVLGAIAMDAQFDIEPGKDG